MWFSYPQALIMIAIAIPLFSMFIIAAINGVTTAITGLGKKVDNLREEVVEAKKLLVQIEDNTMESRPVRDRELDRIKAECDAYSDWASSR